MKAFLMHPDSDFDLTADLPALTDELVQDLELDTLLTTMASGDEFLYSIAQRAVLSSLHDAADIEYRQHVLKDAIRNPDTIRQIYELADEAITRERKVFGGLSRGIPDALLRRSIEVMQIFIEVLVRLRDIAAQSGGDFTSAGLTRLCSMIHEELDDDYLASIDDHLKQLKFDHGILLSAELGRGNKAAGYVLRRPDDTKLPWWKRLVNRDHTGLIFRIADRDEAGADALSELRGRGVSLAASALAQSTDHILSFFKMLKADLAFYIGALNLHDALVHAGGDTCFPDAAEDPEQSLTFTGLYDPSLRLTTGQDVIGNDLRADGKALIVITGANQGGKSTFLRSVGISQLMFQCGLFAPATSYRSNICDRVYSHFKREEDSEMVSGKLDEEMDRMSQIVSKVSPTSLVLFNESFSATNEREGSEIARQIIRALNESRVKIVFVTHMYDLANSLFMGRSPTAKFLRAERREDGYRTFHIIDGEPLPTSYGDDLYRKIFTRTPRQNHDHPVSARAGD